VCSEMVWPRRRGKKETVISSRQTHQAASPPTLSQIDEGEKNEGTKGDKVCAVLILLFKEEKKRGEGIEGSQKSAANRGLQVEREWEYQRPLKTPQEKDSTRTKEEVGEKEKQKKKKDLLSKKTLDGAPLRRLTILDHAAMQRGMSAARRSCPYRKNDSKREGGKQEKNKRRGDPEDKRPSPRKGEEKKKAVACKSTLKEERE